MIGLSFLPGDPEDEGELVYALGTIADGGRTFAMNTTIDAAQHQSVVDALAQVGQLAPSFHYKLVERNFHDLVSVHQLSMTVLSLGREFGRPDRMGLWNSMMTTIVNWLAAMRIYLDHEQTRMARTFGGTSDEVLAFRAATSTVFDARIGYRFATKFRNFILHCGLPRSTIRIGQDDTKASGASATFVLDRAELLRSYDSWGVLVTKDLAQQESKFDPIPLLRDAMEGVREIQETVLTLRLDHALANIKPLVSAIDVIGECEPGDQAGAFTYTLTPDNHVRKVTPTALPVDLIRRFAAVASGKSPRQSLWDDLPVVGRPPVSLDPDRLRADFHRDGRGVQTILTWLSEGGATDVFKSEVDRMIDEDGSSEPLIGGLIYVAACLAHVASGALGTSPQSLLTGLVNMYVQADPSI